MEGLRATVIQSQDMQIGEKWVTGKEKLFHRIENILVFCFVLVELYMNLDFGKFN